MMTIGSSVSSNGGRFVPAGTSAGSHAINRSQELLSCARTALKIAKAEEEEKRRKQALSDMDDEEPSSSMLPELIELQLHPTERYGSSSTSNQYNVWVEDASKILSVLDSRLTKLNGLVKNRSLVIADPTKEIHNLVQEFQTISSRDLVPIVQQLATLPSLKNGKQKQQHYKYIAAWMQTQAAAKTKTLEGIMKLRANLLKEYHQARQRLIVPTKPATTTIAQTGTLQPNSNHIRSSIAPRKSNIAQNQLSSPLFQNLPSQKKKNNHKNKQNTNGHSQPTDGSSSLRHNPNPYHDNNQRKIKQSNNNPYNSSSNAVGYGAGAYDSYYSTNGSSGMNGSSQLRRRGNASSATSISQTQQQQQQQQEFQEKQQHHIYKTRQKSRADMARQTESKLAELSSLFGKMSTLIVAQGETLEKIEDDVEAAVDYVDEGHEQINTLYEITQNNRSLIIKVFTILIVLIIFMKLY